MRVRHIIFLMLVFCSLTLRAQTDTLRLAYSVQGIVTDGETGKAVRRLVVKKPLTLRLAPKEMSIVINFTRADGYSRLSYFRSAYRFNCDWKKRLFATSYTAVNELVVTDVRHPAVPIAKEDAFRTADIMSDKAAAFLDPDFWRDNIIEPTESLEHAVRKLKKGRN